MRRGGLSATTLRSGMPVPGLAPRPSEVLAPADPGICVAERTETHNESLSWKLNRKSQDCFSVFLGFRPLGNPDTFQYFHSCPG